MTFEEAIQATNEIEIKRLHELAHLKRKDDCVKELRKKICSRINCSFCIWYRRGCAVDGLNKYSDDQLKDLAEWAGVKIKNKVWEND